MNRNTVPILLIVGGAVAGVILMSYILLSGADQRYSPRIPPSVPADTAPPPKQ
jgi:hypothetical protein